MENSNLNKESVSKSSGEPGLNPNPICASKHEDVGLNQQSPQSYNQSSLDTHRKIDVFYYQLVRDRIRRNIKLPFMYARADLISYAFQIRDTIELN